MRLSGSSSSPRPHVRLRAHPDALRHRATSFGDVGLVLGARNGPPAGGGFWVAVPCLGGVPVIGPVPAIAYINAFWVILGGPVLDPFWTPKTPKKGRINGNMRWLGYVRLPCGTSLDDVFLGCFWGYPPFCRVRSPFFEGFQKSYKMTPKKTDQKSGFFRKTAISPNTRKGQLCRFWVFPRNFENFARS